MRAVPEEPSRPPKRGPVPPGNWEIGTENAPRSVSSEILAGIENGLSIVLKPSILLVPGAGIEPARRQAPRDFKSLASTYSATQA
jgi:hypothetical protein